MTRQTRTRYGIFVHNPDGDMGFGQIVGAFLDPEAADRKAESIRRAAVWRGRRVEPIVVPLVSGAVSVNDLVEEIGA